MDKLKSMQVFVHVAEQGRFTAAAHEFQISATMVGRHINFLESSLGAPLISRTTRKQSLTLAGETYYQECKKILDSIEAADNAVHALSNSPKGRVSINAPVSFGHEILTPIVADFLLAHPDISIKLTLDNELIDPVHDDVDLVFRIGELNDSSIIGRFLLNYEMIYCAAPSYLKRHGTPTGIDDLSQHNCLGFSYSSKFVSKGKNPNANAFGKQPLTFESNSGLSLTHAAIKGLGIVLQPRMVLAQAISQGSLYVIDTLSPPTPRPIHLLYKNKQLPLKTRAFVNYFLASMDV
ncbi:LysR family transcriptional regulator [Shewanella sp. SR44-3]|uniref:LysR family transcriptional regulator n=1 Tax=Shewanella sp. SR44-3 TaxID=2760936 RepID=UPI0015FDD1C5|nr:LysR family transcriptional regulator [Shewanella sp. SR44-3]MBB1270908.1 LysR family transcriptional regulator [Shewanella sp. SR44-3]